MHEKDINRPDREYWKTYCPDHTQTKALPSTTHPPILDESN